MLDDTGVEAPEVRLEAMLGRAAAAVKLPEPSRALDDYLAVSVAALGYSRDAKSNGGQWGMAYICCAA